MQKDTNTMLYVKGLSHHEVAESLGEWLPQSVGMQLMMVLETAEQNEVGVECVAVYAVDVFVGYIDDYQKKPLIWALRYGDHKALRTRVLDYDEGLGAEGHYLHAKLMVEAPVLPPIDPELIAQAELQSCVSPWDKWTYEGPLLPESAQQRRLQMVLDVLKMLSSVREPWNQLVAQYTEALCRNSYIDMSFEMRQDMINVMFWLERYELPEAMQCSAKVLKTMTDMGGEDLRRRNVKELIHEPAMSKECLALLSNGGVKVEYLCDRFMKMPYSMELGNEQSEMVFMAKLHYDNALTRLKHRQILSVVAMCHRLMTLMRDKVTEREQLSHERELSLLRAQLEVLQGKAGVNITNNYAEGSCRFGYIPNNYTMSTITNNYAEGSCRFEAGSSQNGDVHISGNIYQGGAERANDEGAEAVASPVRLNTARGTKIDFIRVMNCLYELGFFTDEHGGRISKKEVMTQLGLAVGMDLSSYDNDLARSLSDSTHFDKHMIIFNRLSEKMKEVYDSFGG